MAVKNPAAPDLWSLRSAVVSEMRSNLDPWETALRLLQAAPDFDNLTRIEMMRSGRLAPVLEVAQELGLFWDWRGSRWSHQPPGHPSPADADEFVPDPPEFRLNVPCSLSRSHLWTHP